MSISEDLLNYYLTDFENCVDTDKLEPLKKAGSDLVTCADNWKEIVGAGFDEYQLKTYFENQDDEKRLHYFTFGIACLTHFVQRNFTGPDFPHDIGEFLSSDLFTGTDFTKLLAVNSEDINVNTEFPQLLAAAKVIFSSCHFNEILNLWWTWRATIIHQQVLDEPSPTLLSTADRLRKEIYKLPLSGRFAFEVFVFVFTINSQDTTAGLWRTYW